MQRAIFSLIALLAAVGPAAAAARAVALVGVSGPGGPHFGQKIAEDLGEICEVVTGDVYRAAAERLGRPGASPEDVRAVAAAVHVDAVVGGAIVGSGRARQLLIAVRDGVTGRLVARGRYDLGTASLPMVRDRVVRDLVLAFEHTGRREGPMATQEPLAPSPSPSDSSPIETGDASPELSLTKERASESESLSQGVFAGVGYSLLGRRLLFDVASAPGMAGGTVSGIRADAAVFPLALSAELASAHPVLASFGLVGSYEHIFTFTSSTESASSRGHASHWVALLVGRIPLGHAARGGTLMLETGFQQLDWGHESALDVRVPDVTYEMIDAGLSWDRALGTPRLGAALRVAYLALLDAGAITSQAEYGKATGAGVELEAGLTGWPTRWLWIRIDARFNHVGLSFAHNGTRFAGTAKDEWIGGTLAVGFAL